MNGNNWLSKCHVIRNSVMHKSKKPEMSQAQEALSSAKEFLELLKPLLYDENDWILEGTAFINDRKKAKKYFEKSNTVKLNPEAYYYLGLIESEAKNLDPAINCFKEGLKLIKDPFFKPHFYFHMGRCYEDQGSHSDAIKEYDESIRIINSQTELSKRKFLIRHPYNNPYYRKYRILITQKLSYKPTDMVNLFNALLEIFPHHHELQKLRDDFSKSN